MSPAFPARRRADEFNDLVESASTRGDATPDAPADLRELVALATSMTELPIPQPRAAFSADLRERLMAAAATDLTPATTTSAVQDKLTVRGLSGGAAKQRRQRRFTVAVATLAVLGGTTGTALASQGSLPGDTLYPVKRAIENVHTGLSQGDQSKGKSLISDADTRLTEVDKLSQRRQADQAEEIASTLTTFSDQAQHASILLMKDYQSHHDAASITALHQFTQQSITQLTRISASLPATAQPALTQAAQILISIDQLAEQACPTCGSLGITELPSSLISATGSTLQQLTNGLTGQPGTASSAGGDTGLPQITLPKVNASTLPPATPPSNAPASSAPQNGGKASAKSSTPSAKQTGSTTAPKNGGTTTKPTSTPSKVATSVPSTLGDTVGQVTSGVTGIVKGLVGGLLGGS